MVGNVIAQQAESEEHFAALLLQKRLARERRARLESEAIAEQATRALYDSQRTLESLNAELEQRVAERTAQFEAANKELEAFSYSVSHDLRAPLRSIDGFSQAILEDCANCLDEQARDYLCRVRAASQRMGHLIDDLLDLSRMSRCELRDEQVSLSEIAKSIAEELTGDDPRRSVEFKIARNVVVRGDPRLLTVALENLLGNAWKYTGKKQRATIEFGLRQDGLSRVFFVRDNGAGFDIAHANKLFGAFQRLHSSEEFPGTGVGLATVQRIIRRHRGRVWAEAQPDQGATFSFTLQTEEIHPWKSR